MKRSVIVIVAVLLLVGGLGGYCEWQNGQIVRRYLQELARVEEALRTLRWEEAGEQLEALLLRWKRESGWVQLWMNHADTDAVTHALHGLKSSVRMRDPLSALLHWGDCVENFEHLHHRDAFTLKNIL